MSDALKDLRADITTHLARGIGAAGTPLGGSLNPPAVLVAPAAPYLTPSSYGMDAVLWDVTVVAPPGDPQAVIDALDDLVDKVRATLFTKSAGGRMYGFRGVSSPTTITVDDVVLPAVLVTVGFEREAPRVTA